MEPETSQLLPALIEFVPVLGGALIGIAGGLVGTKYAHGLSSRDESRNLKRSKLEDLVAECNELDVWLKKLDNYFLFGGPEVIEQSPVSRIEAIQVLYFPELRLPAAALSHAEAEYRRWLAEGAQLRIAAGSRTPPNEHTDRINDFYRPLLRQKAALISEAQNLARKLERP